MEKNPLSIAGGTPSEKDKLALKFPSYCHDFNFSKAPVLRTGALIPNLKVVFIFFNF